MKRTALILTAISLCLTVFFSINVGARTHNVCEDMSITVDEASWYVFTRDNIKNNPELDEVGILYEKMYKILYNNNAYMDAILLYEDGNYVELLIRKNPVDSGMINLSDYSDENVAFFTSGLAKKVNAQNFSTYKNQYKFAKLEYVDAKFNYHICEYVTIVNKEAYTLTFQATEPFSDEEYEEIKSIVDSIQFRVDETLKEKNSTSFWNNVLTKTIIGSISGAVIGGIVSLITVLTIKKRNRKNAEISPCKTPADTQ